MNDTKARYYVSCRHKTPSRGAPVTNTPESHPHPDVEAELAALSDGEHNEEVVNVLSKAPNAPLVAPMPVAPTNEVTITTGDSDEDMLAQLQAEFA